jgi:hypothetical protein
MNREIDVIDNRGATEAPGQTADFEHDTPPYSARRATAGSIRSDLRAGR